MVHYVKLTDGHQYDDGWVSHFNGYIGKTIIVINNEFSASYDYKFTDLSGGNWGIRESWTEESTEEEFNKENPLWSSLKVGDVIETYAGRCGTVTDIYPTHFEIMTFKGGLYNVGCTEIVNKSGSEEIPNIMNVQGVNTTAAVHDTVIEEMETLFDEYDYEHEDSALKNITDEWDMQKGKLRAIFRKHPKWDESLQMIVLKRQPFTKEISWDDIRRFTDEFFNPRTHAFARENQFKIGFFTYDEYRDMIATYVKNVKFLEEAKARGISANYHGTKLDELKIETIKMQDVLNKAKYLSKEVYLGLHDYRLDADKVWDVKFLKRTSEILNKICGDKGEGFLDGNVFTKDGIERCAMLFLGDLPTDVYNNIKTKLKPQVGQSLPKWIGKICTYYGFDKYVDMQTKRWYDDNGNEHRKEFDAGYNKYRAVLGDACNNTTYKEDVYISINPLDYLTSSFLYNATSCHSIDKKDKRNCHKGDYQGCYSSGTVSYMLDDCSIVMYTIKRDGDKVNRIGKEADPNAPVYRATKFRRMMAYAGEDKLICSRVYPDGRDGGDLTISDQFRAILQKVFTDCLKVEDNWKVEKGITSYGVKDDYATCYPDWSNYDDCVTSFLKTKGNILNYKNIKIGREPICIVCGDRHSNPENVTCCGCLEESSDNYTHCYDCGRTIDLENDNYISTEDGNYFCDYECAENAGYRYVENDGWYHLDDLCFCDNCEEYYRNDIDKLYVDQYVFCCEDCAESFGCVYDDYKDEWTYDLADEQRYDEYDGLNFIMSWHNDYVFTEDDNYYVNQENAIAAGYEYDNATGEWVRKAEDEEVA